MFLNIHSQYSLRYGTMDIKAILKQAEELGITELVLTDINNSTGAMEFIRTARKTSVRPMVGIEFRRDSELMYIGIAQNKAGMGEINRFLSHHNLEKLPLPDRPGPLQNVYFVFPGEHLPEELGDNEFIGIRPQELNRMVGKDVSAIKEKGVILFPVTVGSKIEHRLHQYLRAINNNVILTKLKLEDICDETEMFIPPNEVEAMYGRFPFLIENTRRLIASCSTQEYEFGNLNRKTFTGSKKDDKALLEKMTWAGMEYRYGPGNKQAIKKINEELKVVYDLNFCAYFLITWDIVRYSMSRGYYHVGRGSGANSIVAYCLRITDVDPLELDLYFERFLNPKRTSPPDFDVDFSWDEREDVQDYIFKRYGAERTALLGTMTTFKDRSIIREIGKVLGLTATEIDAYTDRTREHKVRDNDSYKKIFAIHRMMEDMPNQRSIHAGGVLISEEPIFYYTALDLPPKGMPTVQWDMYEAEGIGYDKYDILSQRGIGHIKEAAQLVLENQRIKIDVHDVKAFKKDPRVNEQLRSGDTIGCFYIESPAMRQLLKKLRCGDYLTLVAASSIIRPGVASSGMMKNYIYYNHHPDEVKYLHPVMGEQLRETYGVMVYQEDVIKVCHHYAGLDMADADVLRRGMSGKYRSKAEFDRLVEKFFAKAKEIGRDETITKEIWRQVSSFAGYSFSKAHSASFAVESYQSLYLKTYFPIEFMVAVLNNHGGFYSRWVYVHELRKAGATIHLPCVNHSDAGVVIYGTNAYLGFEGINGLEHKFVEGIPKERRLNGEFLDLENFIRRMGLGLEQCILLIRIGACRFTDKNKKELLWDVHGYLGQKYSPKGKRSVAELFHVAHKDYTLPALVEDPVENAYQELEILGYPLTISMFDLLKTSKREPLLARDLADQIGKVIRIMGHFVCYKDVNTKNDKRMWFGTFLDTAGAFFDTTHFPNATGAFPFKGGGCYLIEGKVAEDFGFPSIEVKKIAKLTIQGNPILSTT